MTTLREAAALALEALESHLAHHEHGCVYLDPAVLALRAALANDINQDWSLLEATQEALREHMAEIHRLRAALAEPTSQESRQVEPMHPEIRKLWEGYFDKCFTAPPQRKPLQWHKAPVKTEWGEDMVEALVEIDKDHTLKLYCEYDQAARVEAMISARKPLTNQEIMREYAALWPFLQSEDHVLAQDILKFARAIERAHGIGGEE